MGAGARTLLAVEHPVRAAHQEGPHEDELGDECADRHGSAHDQSGRARPESSTDHNHGGEHHLDPVEGREDQTADAQAQRERDSRGAELQRSLQEGDREDHPEPHPGDGTDDGVHLIPCPGAAMPSALFITRFAPWRPLRPGRPVQILTGSCGLGGGAVGDDGGREHRCGRAR